MEPLAEGLETAVGLVVAMLRDFELRDHGF
jgi:hypothetical protein